MKVYPMERIIAAILSLKQLTKMSHYATAKVGKDVRVVSDKTYSCYSMNNWRDGIKIQLGSTFYQEAFDDNQDVDVLHLKDKVHTVSMIMFGAFYHELFHLLYTPFGFASDLTSNCNRYFQDFVHQVSNILEDITIEGTGMNRFPFTEKYILAVKEVFKLPKQLELISQAISEEPDNPGTLLGYLLHFCRGTDMSQFPEYKLWEDYKEFIEWGAYKCINTIDAKTRAKRQVAFALELTKILDMKEPDKDNVENPNMSDIDNQSSGFNKSSSGKGMSAVEQATGNRGNDYSESSLKGETTPQDTDEDAAKSPEEEKKQQTRKAQHESPQSEEDPCTTDLTKSQIKMLANDVPLLNSSHYADKLNKYKDTKEYLPEYNKVVRQFDTQIRNVVATIRKMLATNNSSWNHYKMKGKLDMSTIYKQGNYKVFKKKNAPAEAADLVFEILVDNSGSMSGKKAKLAGQALIIFCESLSRLSIPFSVDCFTEGHSAITISLKDYNESYDRVKTNMTLFTEQFEVNKLSTWCGNVDEVNLQYVSDELSLRKEKDKVLVVISDGATCGDWKTLKKLANNIEASGITVLGIGICDDNVSNIYKNSVIFSTPDDLVGLGDYLNKYLIGKILK